MGNTEADLAKIKRTMDALQNNNIEAYLAASKEKAVHLVQKLVPAGAVISCGGSVTLTESGVMDLMKSGTYQFLDRTQAASSEEVNEIYIKTHGCDAFFTSANAITENGELYNVDGTGNRVSAIAHGPKKVIVIAGVNKIVKNLEEAVHRVKTIVAPMNANRLNTKTPCQYVGCCVGVNGGMTDGCKEQSRMCIQYLTSGHQRTRGRITVIFVNESLGY